MPSNRSASFSIRQAVSYSLLGAVSIFAHIPVIQVSSFAVSVLATRYGFDLVALGLALALVTVSDAIWESADRRGIRPLAVALGPAPAQGLRLQSAPQRRNSARGTISTILSRR